MANPNIVNTTSIYGKTDAATAGTAATSITTNSAGSGKIMKVNVLMLANKSGSNVDATVTLARGTSSYSVINAASVPTGSSLIALARENPVYLMEGDAIKVAASAASALDAICSYEELS